MAKQTRTVLKSFFQTGDVPTEGQYVDLIDSNLNLSENNTGDIQLTGDITASGNISASNTSGTHILGGDLTVGDDLFVTDDIHLGGTNSVHKILQRDSNGNLRIGNDSTLQTGAGNTEIEGLNHITASSDEIKIEATSGPLNLVGNVTASNNISSSGTIIANKANIDGNITASGNSAFLGGNISASGQIFSRRVTTDDFRFHTDTVRLLDDSVSGGGDNLLIYEGGLNAQGNITGSSISASGTLLGNSLNLGGTAITATAAELNYCDGVSSNIQTQLNSAATVGKAIAMAIVFG